MEAPRCTVRANKEYARTYAIRKHYLIVYDDEGQAWVGPFHSETLYHIANFGYEKRDYYVPIRGQGEKIAGDPITIDGFTMTNYPAWLGKRSDLEDLEFWAFLEKVWARGDKGISFKEQLRSVTLAPFE